MPIPTRIHPVAGKVQGAERIVVVMSIQNINAPAFATEVDVASSLYCEGFFRDFHPTATQESGTAPRRIMTRQQLPSLGSATWEVPELRYVWRPSETSTTDNNKAYATLVENLECFILRRSDKDDSLALAATHFVDVYHVRLGLQRPDRSGDGSDQFAEYEVAQSVELLRAPAIHKALAA